MVGRKRPTGVRSRGATRAASRSPAPPIATGSGATSGSTASGTSAPTPGLHRARPSRSRAPGQTAGRTAEATAARFTLEVHPDEFYERFYAAKLPHARDAAQRALYEQALARATRSHYVAEQRDVPIAPRP